MQFGNSAGNFGGRSGMIRCALCSLTKLVALLPNSMQIVHNWSEKGVYRVMNTPTGREMREAKIPTRKKTYLCTVVGKSKWYHQVFQGSFHLKR